MTALSYAPSAMNGQTFDDFGRQIRQIPPF